MQKIVFSSSAGKDSLLALYELQQQNKYQVDTLLTTVTGGYDRISMHGVRRSLLCQQARSLGLPLEVVEITKDASNNEYEQKMESVLLRYKTRGVNAVAFGDLFLEGVRDYRIKNLSKVKMDALFPLWGRPTAGLCERFIQLGFKAVVSCIDEKSLDKSFVGRDYNFDFLNDLPSNVDPCGENGEFHSFVYDGPNFICPVKFKKGDIVLRDKRFWYTDLIELG